MLRAEAGLMASHGGAESTSSPAEQGWPDRAEDRGGGEIEEGNGSRAPRGGRGRALIGERPLATSTSVDVDALSGVRGARRRRVKVGGFLALRSGSTAWMPPSVPLRCKGSWAAGRLRPRWARPGCWGGKKRNWPFSRKENPSR